jgi:hypothetical protein
LVFTCPWVKPTDIRSIKVLEAQRESPVPEALPAFCCEGGRVMNEMESRANDRLRIRKLEHEGISRENSRRPIGTRWN